MAWSFDKIVDTSAVRGQFVCRVSVINDTTGEKRTENVWFLTSPNAAAKTAAVTKLLNNLADNDTAIANAGIRQTVIDKVDAALAAGISPATIRTKIQNAIDGN